MSYSQIEKKYEDKMHAQRAEYERKAYRAENSIPSWFRTLLHCRDYDTVSSLSDREYRMWVNILCVAASITSGGYLPPLSELRRCLVCRIDHLSARMEKFESLGLVQRTSDSDKIDARFFIKSWRGPI